MNRRDALKTLAVVPFVGSFAPLAIGQGEFADAVSGPISAESEWSPAGRFPSPPEFQSISFAVSRSEPRGMFAINNIGFNGPAKILFDDGYRDIEITDGRFSIPDWNSLINAKGVEFNIEGWKVQFGDFTQLGLQDVPIQNEFYGSITPASPADAHAPPA
jgi:hypothetical protein